MNMFKNLLFLHGHLVETGREEEAEFGPTYGNRLASEKSFGIAYGRRPEVAGQQADMLCAQGGCG